MLVPKTIQKTFYDVDVWLPDAKITRLGNSWAAQFQKQALPLLIEMAPKFAPFYSADQGAPNKPVATLLGLLLLKEINDLTDAEVLEQFEFNLTWQYALETSTLDAHVCAKTLYNFRQKLLTENALQEFFDELCDKIIARWNIKTSHHRIDSTHIFSNMKILRRLGLFVKTIEQFLGRLKKKAPELLERLPKRFQENYLDRRGYFSDAKSSQSQRRLDQCAKDLWYLIDRFRAHGKIKRLKAYQLLERLFQEQCVVEEQAKGENDADPGSVKVKAESASDEKVEPQEGRLNAEHPEAMKRQTALDKNPGDVREEKSEESNLEDNESVGRQAEEKAVTLKAVGEIASDSLQNPSDPDATYSGHKGKGYQAQLAETCHADNPFQLIDYVEVEGAHTSDQNAPGRIHNNLKRRGHALDKSYVDAGYTSGKNILEAEQKGIELIGPMSGKQPREETLTAGDFEFNEARREVKRCPAGHVPAHQQASRIEDSVNAHFDRSKCDECPLFEQCPTKKNQKTCVYTFSPAKVAAQQRRHEQETEAFKEDYKIRSGVEATNSHLKNERGMRRLRVRGFPAVTLSVKMKSMAENISRVMKYAKKAADKLTKGPEKAHG